MARAKRAGATVEVTADQDIALADRLWLSSGTLRAAAVATSPASFIAGAFVPKAPWQTAPASFRAGVTGACPDVRRRITVFRVPCELHRALAGAVSAIAEGADPPTFEASDAAGREAVGEARAQQLTDCVAGLIGEPLNFFSGWKLGYWPPGRVTATSGRSAAGGQLIGLHIDSWQPRDVAHRHEAPSLVSINIGVEDRHFLYVDLDLAEIFARLAAHGLADDLMFQHTAHMPERFFTCFDRYPVTRLTLAPGEGYIAPVENLIHDASTAERTRLDVFVTCRVYIGAHA